MADPAPPKSTTPVSVLFVCLGNICRSPLAHAVLEDLSSKTSKPLISHVESCGTSAYHVGSSPDRRTLATLSSHGIKGFQHGARMLSPDTDFDEFDYILTMDRENLEDVEDERRRYGNKKMKKRKNSSGTGSSSSSSSQSQGQGQTQQQNPDGGKAYVGLFGDFGGKVPGRGEEVNDPYYGGNKGFEIAYEQVNRFSKAFLKKLEQDADAAAEGGS